MRYPLVSCTFLHRPVSVRNSTPLPAVTIHRSFTAVMENSSSTPANVNLPSILGGSHRSHIRPFSSSRTTRMGNFSRSRISSGWNTLIGLSSRPIVRS